MGNEQKRCFWCNLKNPVYVAYHDHEWGAFPEGEQKLYELFILETFQAGLSWECILNKRENFRKAYDGFDADKICAYGMDITKLRVANCLPAIVLAPFVSILFTIFGIG